MTKKENFVGYDETHDTNPNKQQTNMDSNILYTMVNLGIRPKPLEGSILHLDHGKPHEKEGFINPSPYKNRDDWGMRKVEIKTFENI